MAVPGHIESRLALPVIGSPMFLTSGPDLVVALCRSGVLGTFPALNQRTSEGYEAWLVEIGSRLAEAGMSRETTAPFGVNLSVHRSNPRLAADLELTIKHRVPLVITSLGAVGDVVDAVHSYGGLVLHDVINTRHAEKAIEAGVDGLVAVCAGAGGHAGMLSPFAFVHELRTMFDGMIVLAGAISNGRQVAAARMLGADLAYVGTRFIATKESLVSPEYKKMIVEAKAADIVYTPNISGIHANFLRPSLTAAGLDPDNLPAHGALDMEAEAKAWKSFWSAGQGVGAIDDVPAAADLCRRLVHEYRDALRDPFQ